MGLDVEEEEEEDDDPEFWDDKEVEDVVVVGRGLLEGPLLAPTWFSSIGISTE